MSLALRAHVQNVLNRFRFGDQVTNLCSVVYESPNNFEELAQVWQTSDLSGDLACLLFDAEQTDMNQLLLQVRQVMTRPCRIIFIANADAMPDHSIFPTLRKCDVYSNVQPFIVLGFKDAKVVDHKYLRGYLRFTGASI